jgi:hypothetical protein
MKIRFGFVSNSSSTSFTIYGASFEPEELKDLLKEIGKEGTEIDEVLHGTQLQYNVGEYDTVYVGRSWDSIKDDETGKQFKDSIERDLKDLFKKDISCGTHEEGWYNG